MSGADLVGAVNIRLSECETIELSGPVLACAMPTHGKITLFVRGPKHQPGRCDLAMAEAEALHATLGQAIALMKRPGRLADELFTDIYLGAHPGEIYRLPESTERTLYWGGKRRWLQRRFLRRLGVALLGLALALALAAVFILPALWGGR